MESWMWIVIVVGLVLLIALVAWVMTRQRRTEELRREIEAARARLRESIRSQER